MTTPEHDDMATAFNEYWSAAEPLADLTPRIAAASAFHAGARWALEVAAAAMLSYVALAGPPPAPGKRQRPAEREPGGPSSAPHGDGDVPLPPSV